MAVRVRMKVSVRVRLRLRVRVRLRVMSEKMNAGGKNGGQVPSFRWAEKTATARIY